MTGQSWVIGGLAAASLVGFFILHAGVFLVAAAALAMLALT